MTTLYERCLQSVVSRLEELSIAADHYAHDEQLPYDEVLCEVYQVHEEQALDYFLRDLRAVLEVCKTKGA